MRYQQGKENGGLCVSCANIIVIISVHHAPTHFSSFFSFRSASARPSLAAIASCCALLACVWWVGGWVGGGNGGGDNVSPTAADAGVKSR
jgi:hypothetical protein